MSFLFNGDFLIIVAAIYAGTAQQYRAGYKENAKNLLFADFFNAFGIVGKLPGFFLFNDICL